MLPGGGRGDGGSVAAALDRIEALALRPSKTWVNGAERTVYVPFDERVHHPGDGPPTEECRCLLEALPPRERLVVQLRFWDDLTAPEIAALLGDVTPRQVLGLLERAMKAMRNEAYEAAALGRAGL